MENTFPSPTPWAILMSIFLDFFMLGIIAKTEKNFAIILEQNFDVLKWSRPALNQFRIYQR